jgi:hypothetical protein
MTPIRKSDGYTPEGIKKYKRFFQIVSDNDNANTSHNHNNSVKQIEVNL